MPPKSRAAKDFQTKGLKDHILDIPDTYVGSTDLKMKKEWIYDFETKQMKQVEMDLPEAVKRVTLEIISNAGDHSYFAVTEGVNPGKIDFSWDDEGYLCVKNGGPAFPVEPHNTSTPTDLVYVPSIVFSEPLTSSNYDTSKDRIGCGRNGYGSKLTNSFSTHFVVQIGDSGRTDDSGNPVSGQEYVGEWKDNMKTLVRASSSPGFRYSTSQSKWIHITSGAYNGPSYVQVSWKLDFQRMNMKKGSYTEDELGLFTRYMLEFSLTCGVPVSINGVDYDYRSIRKFAGLFYHEDILKTAISQFCVSKEIPFPKKYDVLRKESAKEEFIANSGFIPESQILLIDTPDDGQSFTYVNGLVTSEGGVHLEKLQKELFTPIAKAVSDKHKGTTKLSAKDVKPHVTVFLVCRLRNTKYNSQSKTKLENPVPMITFPDTTMKSMLSNDWALSERLQGQLSVKSCKDLNKSDGKKSARVKIPGLEDANLAGTGKSHLCDLTVVEGDSALLYPKYRIDNHGSDGKDLFGIYPLRGKFMNVLTHDAAKVAINMVFGALKGALGLKQEMDYTSDANFKTLRYGSLTIMTDADSDGAHIMGLLILLFYVYWPSLYERGFIRVLDTPVVRVYRPDGNIKFYSERAFNEWFKNHPKTPSKSIKYCKGLSNSTPKDVEEDMADAPTRILDLDDKGKELIRRAFDKTLSDERKIWIQEWREIRDKIIPNVPKSIIEHRPVSDIMGISFPPYMIDNLFRSIPSYFDGLKKSQRQILYYGLHLFNYGKTYDPGDEKGNKLIEFSAAVIGYSKYHHGDSLPETTIKMTQDYCGSNNLPIFKPLGLYGTRDGKVKKSGKITGSGTDHGAPRYLALAASWWMQYAFDKTMISLVPRREVDGELAEPLWIPCDIPLGIINGALGVATGWSSYIPPHHPIAVIDWILARLAGKKRIEPLVPYFRGYRGNIEMKIKVPKKGTIIPEANIETSSLSTEEEEDTQEIEETIPDFYKGRGFITQGNFEIIKEYSASGTMDVKITEIPISVCTKAYLEFIDSLIDEGRARDKRNTVNNARQTLCIEVYNLSSNLATHTGLKLECGYPLSNMVMLDNDGIPIHFESVESMLAKYVVQMREMYRVYQIHVIKTMEENLVDIRMKMKIIKCYLEKKLVIIDRSDDNITDQLTKLELDKKIFHELKLSKLSETQIKLLKQKLDEMEKELEIFRSKTPEILWTERLTKLKSEFIRQKIYAVSLEDAIVIDDSSNMIIDGEVSYKKALVNCIYD